MIGASPHQYRAGGKAVQRPDAVIEAAIRQAAAIERNGVPAILTIRHLAFRTGETYRYLRSIAAARDGKHYREFLISKRSGGKRRIVVPEPRLMAIQRWIARHILRERLVDAASFAYAPSSSILRCAAQHSGAGWLVKLDIHDFFESITETQVYRVFRSLGYQPLVAFELARLCTRPWVDPPFEALPKRRVGRYRSRGLDIYRRQFTGYLPQGAPTSPMLSNLVCRKLDSAFTAFAAGQGIVYTRYSDDLTFSGAKGTFNRDTALAIVNDARIILAHHGFRLHEGKITIVPPGSRKQVLGLLVDRATPRLTKELRSRLTDHIRGIEKFGVASHAQVRGFASPTGMVAHIGGLIRFARHIEPTFGSPLLARYNAALLAHSWSPPA